MSLAIGQDGERRPARQHVGLPLLRPLLTPSSAARLCKVLLDRRATTSPLTVATWLVNAQEAEQVREMFRLYRQHRSLSAGVHPPRTLRLKFWRPKLPKKLSRGSDSTVIRSVLRCRRRWASNTMNILGGAAWRRGWPPCRTARPRVSNV